MKKHNKETVILDRRFVPQGSIIMKEGETSVCAFLIQSGRVKIYAGPNKIELATMEAGQIFGEMALVFDEPRTATVEALEDCNLIVITREKLMEKLDRSDPTVRAIVPMLMKRLLQSNNVILNKENSLDEMLDTVTAIYENIARNQIPTRKKTLENMILPKLQDLTKAVREFQAQYKDNP
jgi:CRP/FNR family transcriptional regulator, cyclic AMP receptor protein